MSVEELQQSLMEIQQSKLNILVSMSNQMKILNDEINFLNKINNDKYIPFNVFDIINKYIIKQNRNNINNEISMIKSNDTTDINELQRLIKISQESKMNLLQASLKEINKLSLIVNELKNKINKRYINDINKSFQFNHVCMYYIINCQI